MAWVAVRRFRSEPIRLATLAILFAATVLAAIMLPRQIRAALDASAVSESGVTVTAPDTNRATWWTPPAPRAVPESAHHRPHKAAHCRVGCQASDDAHTEQ
ncbi:MAG TPA: hypothetical protein VGL55_16665 [Steroidobacteraceae bacterium]